MRGGRLTLHLVRHGQSTWNAEGRMQGQQDPQLSALGRDQARKLARRLRADNTPIDAILTSDLARARETAEIVAEAYGLTVALEPALRERHYGDAETRLIAELQAEHGGTYPWWDDPDQRFVGGESGREHHARVAAYLRRLIEQPPGEHLLLVAHGGTVRYALATLDGHDLDTLAHVPTPNGALVTRSVERNAVADAPAWPA